MPAQKRSAEDIIDDDDAFQQQQHQYQQQQQHLNHVEEEEVNEDYDGEANGVGGGEEENEEDFDQGRSDSEGDDDKDEEFVIIKLSEIRKEVQCPICLGIIRKTRTVMECLHRFCRECIDKSMRLGNNECPACRTHCASRRSLRDDPNYDTLIAVLYPDIDKYEEEIQESIAETFRRQMEALSNRKAATRKSLRQSRKGRSGRNSRAATELQASGDDEDRNGNQGGRDSSSGEERVVDAKPKRYKGWGGARFRKQSTATTNGDESFGENNDSENAKEVVGASPGFIAWGKGGARSGNRHGSLSGSNSKNGKIARPNKLADYLRNSEENEEKYVALQTQIQAEKVEIFAVKEPRFTTSDECISLVVIDDRLTPTVDPYKDELQVVKSQETLSELQANFISNRGHLVFAYRQKASS
ncbi:hypothetical protein GIB67_037897 [Kingdonia uniflora]|uniref:RING-type domain-containing protein n=1 Tax=Kingdonia uniflora TaxID=39325 RepID=A0A7J7LHB4_9MAGN|nr:hypothetical protein GIB67_037897 [Kingdonia uniflora]